MPVLLPFPSLQQRMAASAAVPREPSGRIFRQIWKAPDMLQAQSGKIWKTLEHIYSNYPKDILSSKEVITSSSLDYRLRFRQCCCVSQHGINSLADVLQHFLWERASRSIKRTKNVVLMGHVDRTVVVSNLSWDMNSSTTWGCLDCSKPGRNKLRITEKAWNWLQTPKNQPLSSAYLAWRPLQQHSLGMGTLEYLLEWVVQGHPFFAMTSVAH